ncbi:type II toxin-antitoxin system prevent-host-death family antitoxin [Deinococcus metallilatus]|uniref:Antitoxin n=1 Tax=Deinococcus metallilatus TaxID=1211322 RepID=A0AAJ5F6H1_9DEIO|nr:type II toxin-antitoxin system prevent-host-death family antitoxin [Deinococcus metallilatus]MBB5295048.1 prevent-host-death family protein [Deinococcus metallilatus]QBY08770.1 type II toxin-antitoxin system prevent-host-death family antitoxin [Deinococcus metallilatus]RXJ10650.1 type II toxin-antitoxin system prevent-host-death family antitoxin [Deinococcus metallilatus]TLK26621.1 type II toxin-antitoxin system prevent-host-death family antitoxin [Deinococcus metallilatus]GMA14820.1 antito
MTKTVKLQDAKAKLSQLIREVEAGETVIVTRHGKPAARLVAVEPEGQSGPVRMAIEALRDIPKIEDLEFERDRTPWGDIELDFD